MVDGPILTPGQAFALDQGLVDLLRGKLPEVAEHTIAAVMDEVPSYAGAFGGPMGNTIEQAVQMALAGFLRLATRGRALDPGTPLSPALEGAYALGRGEARSGRSADALLSAYRVGARVAWRELAATAVANDVPADTVAAFAELVFAYIDELSAASVAGHADELETSGRVRQRYLDRLTAALLRGDSADALVAAASRADWRPPKTLTAVLLPEAQVRPVLGLVDARTLHGSEDVSGLPAGLTVLLVPDLGGRSRGRLMRTLAAPQRRRRSVPAVARGADVVRPGRPGPPAAHRADLARHRGAPARAGARRRPRGAGRPARAGAGAAGRPEAGRGREAHQHAARVAAAPGPARRRGRRAVRAPADRALPDGAAARAVRRAAGRPGHGARPDPGPRGGRASSTGLPRNRRSQDLHFV